MFKIKLPGGRLRNKILSTMSIVGIIPLIILGILALFSLNFFHRSDIASIENNLINQKVEEVKGFIEDIVSTFQLQVGFEQISEIELSHQHFLLKGLLEEFSELEEAAFISLSGQETSRFNRAFPEGVPADELQDQDKIEKFIIVKSGKNYIGPIYFTINGPMITIASPVLNRNGIVISVLTGEVNLSNLQKIIQRSKLGSDGYLYLVDKDGFLIAHSQPSKVVLQNLRSINFVDKLLSNDNLKNNIKNRYQSFWGENIVAAGTKMENLGLAIIAEWPTHDADKVINTVRNQILITSALVLLATLGSSIFLTNRIVKPIKTLEAGAHLVAQGKFDQPVSIKTKDEIEDLGIAFNKMIAGLKRLQELKEEFVYIAAHELRAPVTAIKGYLTMIAEGEMGPVSDEVKQTVNEVLSANQRLIKLVNDLLQVARAEAGRLKIEVSPIDVALPIKKILSELKPLADEKKHKVIYEPPTTLPKVLAEAENLKEVMANLISNAIKYTPDGGTITVSHELKEKELITKVKDTGIGISKEAQQKLFEKFGRVEEEKTKGIKGTGLGLYIVKMIIEKMNGKIWVESEEGKGSTFSFSLPLS